MNAGIEPGSGTLIDRAKAIILTPKDEWPKIASETASQGDILRSYVLPLAAIGPIATLIGGQIFGIGILGFSYKPSLMASLSTALISYVLGIVMVFALAFIADFLATKFGGESNRANAFKLVAFGATASWLSGIFSLIPMLGILGLLGLYSFYLFYTGASTMMKVPAEKAVGYTVVTFLCAFVLMLIVTPITVALTGMFGGGVASMTHSDSPSGTITLPGGGSVDLGDTADFGKQMEAAVSGKSPPVKATTMQALLPSSIGSFQRTATETMAMGGMGSTAEATYTAGDSSFTLKIVDMSALGAIAGLGATMGIEQSKEDATSYERTTVVDGGMQTESWDTTSNRGKFGRMFANRFMVEAHGQAESIDQLKAAVAQIDPDDLTDLIE